MLACRVCLYALSKELADEYRSQPYNCPPCTDEHLVSMPAPSIAAGFTAMRAKHSPCRRHVRQSGALIVVCAVMTAVLLVEHLLMREIGADEEW
jgi:hypothetical protein